MKKFLQNSRTLLSTVILLMTFLCTTESYGQKTWDGGAGTANWGDANNWNPNGVPASTDDVTIADGFNVTVNTAAVCNTFTFSGGGTTNTITISGSNSLTVTGAVSIGAPSSNNRKKTIAVGAGSLTCASVTMASTTNDNRDCELTISTGVITVTGSITMNGTAARNAVLFTSSGTLNIGNTMSGGSLTPSTGTVNYNAAGSQTVGTYAYNNLTLSGSGAKTVTGATINAKLSIQGTATASGTSPTYGASAILEYKGSASQTTSTVEFPNTFSTDLIIDNTSGVTLNAAKTITGFITLTSGALIANNNNISLSGNWTNNGGSFTAGTSTVTFTGTSTIGGTVATTFFNLTKNSANTVTNAVDGTTVSGTMSITNGTFIGNNSLTTAYTINVNNFSLTGGTFDSNNTSLAGIAMILSISGSYTQTATSTFTNTGAGVTEVLFTGGGNTTYSNAYTTAGTNWIYAIVHVTNNTTLTLSTDLMQYGVSATGAIVDAGSTLVTGTRLLRSGLVNIGDPALIWEINGTLKTAVTAGLSGSTTTTLDNTNSPVLALGALSTIEYNSTSPQTVTSRADYANITFTGNSTKTAAGTFSASKDLTINSTATFAAGSFTHNVAGNWINNGTFTADTSTINFNGTSAISGSATNTFNNISIAAASSLAAASSSNINILGNWTNNNVFTNNNGTVTFNSATAQAINGATTFYNLALSNSGVKTFNNTTTISANLSIATGVQASLGTFANTAGSLTLGGSGTPSGLWGSTSTTNPSAATYTNNTYFAATTGSVNVASGTCSSYSATISGTATICGGSTTISVAITGGLSPYDLVYTSAAGNVTVNNYISGTAITVSPSLTDTYTIVSVTNTNRCSADTLSGSAVITVNTPSVAPTSITGTTTICDGSSTTLTAVGGTLGTGANYQWGTGAVVGTSPLSGETASTLTVSPSSSTTYWVRIENTTSPCTANTSGVAQLITVNAPSVAPTSITGTTTICYGDSTTLTAVGGTLGTGANFQWGTGAVVGTSPLSGETASTLTVSPSSSTTYWVRIENTNSPCTANTTGVTQIVTVSNANTWTGATSTAWTTASNWSCGIVPASVSDVTISTASNYPEISSNVIINTLTLDSGTTLKVNSSSNLTVTDVIDNDGTLTIENNGNLLQVNNVANTGSGSTVVKRNSSALKRLDYTLWSSPVTGQGLYAFSPLTFANRFYKYVTSTNFYNNSLGFSITGLNPDGVNGTDSNNVPFNTGQGYLIRMPWNHPTTATVWNGQFTGTANNGDYSIGISDNGSGFRYNLIGNPYPSPISAVDFVAANRQSGDERITGVLYFWRETNNTTANNAYCSWSPAGGGNGTFVTNSQPQVFDLNGVIQTGQGFIVEAESGASAVEFDNSMRVNNTAGQFFRTNQELNTVSESNRIWLNVTNASGLFCQTAFGYMTDATMGFDGGIDGRLINDGDIALYSTVGNESLVIQGRALPFDVNDVVPLGLRITNTGNYSISIDHVDGLFSQGQTIYLRDNLTSTVHNLTSGAYNFNSDAGSFTSRFEIIYQLPLGVGTPIFNANQVVIYQNQAKDFVINTGNIVMSSVKVFDIRGRLVQEKKAINASQTTISGGLANEVLLIQITSEDGLVVTKKVVR